jgi:hypothetical protein
MKSFLKFTGIFVALGAYLLFSQKAGASDTAEDFHQIQQQLNSSLLDVYEGSVSPETIKELDQTWQEFTGNLTDPGARQLGTNKFTLHTSSSQDLETLAGNIGSGRSLIQHLAALQMLQAQQAENVDQARLWRDLITLPQFANADEGGLLSATDSRSGAPAWRGSGTSQGIYWLAGCPHPAITRSLSAGAWLRETPMPPL